MSPRGNFIGIAFVAAVTWAGVANGAQPVRPGESRPTASLATAPATLPATFPAGVATRPVAVALAAPGCADHAEAAVARAMADAGDPRIIPVALHWLATEMDNQRVGFGSPRLRSAAYVVELLRVREAAPLLIELYDEPTCTAEVRNSVAGLAIMLDRTNLGFCHEVLAEDAPSIGTSMDNSGRAAAAATLAGTGDESARRALLDGYTVFLDRMQKFGQSANRSFRREVMHSADAELRKRLLELLPKYPADPARNQIKLDAAHIQANGKSVEELMKVATDAEAPEPARFVALVALAGKAGPEVLPKLEKLESWAPTGAPATRPATLPATTPASDPAATQTQPATAREPTTATRSATRPATNLTLPTTMAAAQSMRSSVPDTRLPGATPRSIEEVRAATRPAGPVLGSTDWTILQLRRRHRTGTAPLQPPPLRGAPHPAQPLAADEHILRLLTLRKLGAGDAARTSIELIQHDGHAPVIYAEMRPELFEKVRDWPPETLVRARINHLNAPRRPDAPRPELATIEPFSTRPGEASLRGYILIARRTVRDGKTERQAVELSKLGRSIVARIPNRTAPDGRTIPDTALLAAVAKLREGDVVEAYTEPVGNMLMLAWIGAYRPWQTASFVRWVELPPAAGDTSPVAGVEINLGRQNHTFAPAPGPLAAVQDLLKEHLRAGYNITVQVEDPGATPPLLRSLRVEGYVSRRVGGDTFAMIHSGRANLQGSAAPGGGYRGSLVTGGRDSESSRLRSGLVAVLDRQAALPGEVTPKTREALRQARQIHTAYDSRTINDELNELFRAHESSPSETDREEKLQRMYLRLQEVTAALNAEEQRQVDLVKQILTAEQYQALLKHGKRF